MESLFEVLEWPLSPTRLQRAYDTLAGRRRFLRIYPFLLQLYLCTSSDARGITRTPIPIG
jgi:hypothetical protein